MRQFAVLVLTVFGMDVLCVSGKSFHYLESAQKFGQDNLCKTYDQRQMLQRAILGKVCSSSNTGFLNDDFMMYLVHTLCKVTGGWLADWVLTHVDTDVDGRLSHFEENMFYNNYELSPNSEQYNCIIEYIRSCLNSFRIAGYSVLYFQTLLDTSGDLPGVRMAGQTFMYFQPLWDTSGYLPGLWIAGQSVLYFQPL